MKLATTVADSVRQDAGLWREQKNERRAVERGSMSKSMARAACRRRLFWVTPVTNSKKLRPGG
jgi:hypothetical protein